jgi:hypothetical protein
MELVNDLFPQRVLRATLATIYAVDIARLLTASPAQGNFEWGVTSMIRHALWSCAAFVLALAALGVDPAAAANPLELNFYLSGPRYDGVLPPCDHPAALNQITFRFHQKEDRFWNSDLAIVGYQEIRETAFRPWAPQTIPRRFCSALALVSDGLKHPVHYVIGEDFGVIGESWGIEWCVEGLDRNWAYTPACKMALPPSKD